jgi:hypothetical protein
MSLRTQNPDAPDAGRTTLGEGPDESNADDLLSRATRAMRETTGPTSAPSLDGSVAATTLARIERSTRAHGAMKLRRRAYARWVVLPMAASFLVFTAWASASGRLPGWLSLRAHDDTGHAATRPVPSPSAPPPRVPLQPAAPVPTTPSLRIEELPEPATPPQAAPSATARARKAPPPASTVDADALYRDAHEAHFVRRDPAAALAAWDRYLAAAGPGGRFALEARYNRAISLVRLGRRDEAAAALRPFAAGEYGGYRRDEAAQLLRTLE